MQKLVLYLSVIITLSVSCLAIYQHNKISDQADHIASLQQSLIAVIAGPKRPEESLEVSNFNDITVMNKVPLSPDQINALQQIIKEERSKTIGLQGPSSDPSDPVKAQEDESARVLERSKPLLNPDQWDLLNIHQNTQLQMRKIDLDIARRATAAPEK